MRIVGGHNKGRRLKVQKSGVRPTKAIVREAIFNIIRDHIDEAHALDVFAGSGALGIEALSRGANHCSFIDKDTRALSGNIERFLLSDKTRILKGDFRMCIRKIRAESFDIIFLDPPYYKQYVDNTLAIISQYDLLSKTGIIVVEHGCNEDIQVPLSMSIVKKRKYGETAISVIVQAKQKCRSQTDRGES
jgi:16S rRNA (guanine966-N2)-methyltransferase